MSTSIEHPAVPVCRRVADVQRGPWQLPAAVRDKLGERFEAVEHTERRCARHLDVEVHRAGEDDLEL